MSNTNCDPYITCDQNGDKSDSQLFREMITKNANDCPALRVETDIVANIENMDVDLEVLGNKSTTASDDGDLRNIDTEAEALATNPVSNASGDSTTGYTHSFLLRWVVYLLQKIAGRFPNSLTASGNFKTAIQEFASGTETPTASLVTDSTASPVAAGKICVTFTTSAGFAGTILGVNRNPSTTYVFEAKTPGYKLAAIAYTVTAGDMTIDVQS